jgi:hypothetical protein
MLVRKAEVNLAVANYCYVEGKKGENSYFSISTSRAYYAVFQTAIDCFRKYDFLENSDLDNNGEVRIHHEKMHEKLKDFLKTREAKNKDYDKASTKYNALRKQRNIADYRNDDISSNFALKNIEEAEEIITILRKYGS